MAPSGTNESVKQASEEPVFGKTSLSMRRDRSEPMDWESTLPKSTGKPAGIDDDETGENGVPHQKSDWNDFATGKQRMFAGQGETGLESLLASWGLSGEAKPSAAPHPATPADPTRFLRASFSVLGAFRIIGLVAFSAGLVDRIDVFKGASIMFLVLESALGLLNLMASIVTASPTDSDVRSPILGVTAVLRTLSAFGQLNIGQQVMKLGQMVQMPITWPIWADSFVWAAFDLLSVWL